MRRHEVGDEEWAKIKGLLLGKIPIWNARFDGDSRALAFCGRTRQNGDEALGRSRGGMSTKVSLTVDTQRLPVELLITAGQDHDATYYRRAAI